VTGLDLSPDDLKAVRAILARHVPEFEVRAFGSRVCGTARRTSDLDLAIMTAAPLEAARMADPREAFSESDLAFKVDLVDWAGTGAEFRRVIEGAYVVVQAPAPAAPAVERKGSRA
jgi:predicted nucleotidyltransferase